jgi:dynein heavy chain
LYDHQALEALFIFLVIWSIGGSIVQTTVVKDRDRFDKFVKGIAALGSSPNDPIPPNQLPVDTLYEFCFDIENLQWRSWKSLVPLYAVNTLAHQLPKLMP